MARMAQSRAGRAAQLGGLAGTQAARLAAQKTGDLVRSDARAEAAARARRTLLTQQLVATLGTMRGVAMKLGQILSLVDIGIVGPENRSVFQTALATLQDNAPRVPWTEMRGHLEGELGGPLDEVFAEFEPEPVAAASIGQVYRARLTDGRQVAVKIQYPGIEAAVLADLKNLRTLLTVYRFVHPALDTAALADEFAERMHEELDYRIEARHTGLLAGAHRGHPFIRIPDVIESMSGRRVLVTEWLDGRPLRDIYTGPQAERNRVAEIVFRFYAGTPYRLRHYSGDPHPGNLLLLDDGAVGFLDFGLCKTIDARTAEAELAVLRAGIDGDAALVLELMESRGFARSSKMSEQAAYETFLRVFGWYLCDREADISQENVKDLVALLSRSGDSTGVSVRPFNLPADHVLRGRAEVQLLAILAQLEPRMNLYTIAREWIFDAPPVTELGRAQREWELRR
ncbi:MAG: AarF/ABC1/UbiB kinase family protein [Nocardia sp.]|uniref:ABC1 kinase family protein n=1 Tax=Nocardia sp. TaxID=1821 RepID=UPI00260D4661|nr:AarF/ABC1/UbiB kinase family protein [Nocardia sp.]MCU1642840.1 AarF/ABC1/UbiB kinase family protein [Nocardia sp.]